MTSDADFAYPAEYYYPEFIDNRPDDPRKSPPKPLPLTSSIENGIGSSTQMPIKTITTTPKKQTITKTEAQTSLALDITTDQGLPDADITKAVKTDPKKNLVRDPAERNIPRLIVDDTIIKQTVRTPRVVTTNLDNGFEQTAYPNQTINETKHVTNGYMNGNLTNKTQTINNGYINGDLTQKTKPSISTKQQKIKYVEDEPPIDDYWKKEVHIDDEGVVTIEPLKYDRNTYDGPFGLTRKGSFIFYITVGIFTVLAGVFLILTGIFYNQQYPSSSSTTGTLAGLGICAFAFYLGLQLILIGLWHQKYRQENPKKIIRKSNKHNDSSANLKTSMEENEAYNYSYPQPIDYTSYGDYSNPPYTNEQMLLQQPGAATGAASYEPVVWPSNVQVETEPDSKFLQPMEWSYGPPQVVESPSTVIGYTSSFNAPNNNNSNNNNTKTDDTTEKKKHHHRRHHHNKKTVQADPPKPKFDSIQTNSTVIEAPLPVLSKAPETNELLRSLAEADKNPQQNSTTKNSNRVKPMDHRFDISSSLEHPHHRHHSRHRRHHSHHRHHRHSYSPCSTCSDRSYKDFHSDIDHYHHNHHNHHHHHHARHQHGVTRDKIITARPIQERASTPPRRNMHVYREAGTGTGLETKIMKDSGITANLEDVPNVRDNRLEQIPVVRRTIIVEPYPAEPTSQIIVKPQSNMTGKVRLSKNERLNGNDEIIVHPTATSNKKSKKKKKTIETIEDLKLEDVNDDHDGENDNKKSKKKNTGRTTDKTNVKNAFYN